MFKHLKITKAKVVVAVASTALAAAGVALAQSSRIPEAGDTATSIKLRETVLRANELAGFVPLTCPVAETDADRWAQENGVATDDLRRDGFLVGLREPLQSTTYVADAISVAAKFRSAEGARREVEREVVSARALGDFGSFAVAGIPGARGFTLSGGGTVGYNIAFSRGAFEYLVAISG
jgi:hypothetical protein